MLIVAENLYILQRADQGCPKCQYIMGDYYMNGIGVPKDLERGKHYYKLLATHAPKDLSFLDSCYSSLLRYIGYLEYDDGQATEARKYLSLAASYIRENYPPDEAEKKIFNANIEQLLATIEAY